ncbi:MAG: 3-oxoacyl-ACP synthase [Bacteroidota bacterium]
MIPRLKEHVYAFCQKYADSRSARIHSEIQKLNEGLQSETKSTAGDKHETGRAMLQLEREKLGKQLLEAENMRLVMSRISPNQKSERVAMGSLVSTNRATYFISISAGKFKGKNAEVYCISAKTPIGQLLMGKTAGDTFWFKGQPSNIVSVI